MYKINQQQIKNLKFETILEASNNGDFNDICIISETGKIYILKSSKKRVNNKTVIQRLNSNYKWVEVNSNKFNYSFYISILLLIFVCIWAYYVRNLTINNTYNITEKQDTFYHIINHSFTNENNIDSFMTNDIIKKDNLFRISIYKDTNYSNTKNKLKYFIKKSKNKDLWIYKEY